MAKRKKGESGDKAEEDTSTVAYHRKFTAKVYVGSTLLLTLILGQYATLMIYVPMVNSHLAENYITRISATFFGFLQLLGQVTFTRRLARSPWWFSWPYLILNLELNAVPLSSVMLFYVVPKFFYIMGAVVFLYFLGIVLHVHARRIQALFGKRNSYFDIGIINPIRIHICASVMSETVKSLNSLCFQITVSVIYVCTAIVAHLLFSFTSGQPQYFNEDRGGHLFLIMMNTLSIYVTYGSMVWALNYITLLTNN